MPKSEAEILFIINPISGVKSKEQLPDLIEKCLSKKGISYTIAYTEYQGHAAVLAQEAVNNKRQYIVAAGGDGTINEVASKLINTSTALGIIPLGSGNGLARHLNIPLKAIKAIENICSFKVYPIDTCTFNGEPFFCTAGVGFDAHVSQVFSQKQRRGFKTYIRTTLTELKKYQPQDYIIQTDQQSINTTAFSITAANAAQFGNNAFISPMSSINDGLIDLCILKPFPRNRFLALSLKLFTRKLHRSKYMQIVRCKQVSIARKKNEVVHLDGEPIQSTLDITIGIVPASLRIVGIQGKNI